MNMMADPVQSHLRVRVGNLRILVVRGPLPVVWDPSPEDPDPIGRPVPVARSHLRVRWADPPQTLSTSA